MLKPILLFSAIVAIALSPLPGQARSPQDAAGPAAPKDSAKITADSQAKAKKLFAVDCALCHGDNGNGKTDLATSMALTLPDWTDAKTLADKQDKELFEAIRNGKGKMPPEGAGRAKDDEVWNLIVYIRSFSKGGGAPAPAAAPSN